MSLFETDAPARGRAGPDMMLSLLPDLAPRDVSKMAPLLPLFSCPLADALLAQSHSLWYTSSRNPLSSADNLPQDHAGATSQNQNQRRNTHLIDRSPLARLRADEQTLERRIHNVSHFGSTWLKPPGIPKTLHQIREERREHEEHQEAMRREQMAQELAEAEAAGNGNTDTALENQGEDGMDDVQLDGARDLDEDVPEAAATDFGLSGDEEEEDDDDDENEQSDEDVGRRAARSQQALMAQRMRQTDDPFRPVHTHGGNNTSFYGGEDEIDDEDQAQMIEEEDLDGGGHGMDMGADLDDDIPEAESAGGYEHTDSEVTMSSDVDDHTAEVSFVAARAPQRVRFRGSLARSDATRHSIAISDLLSVDESSMLQSSPFVNRQGGAGPSR